MEKFDLQKAINAICKTGEELYHYINKIMGSSQTSAQILLVKRMKDAYRDLEDLKKTYNSAPVGFTEVLESAQGLMKAATETYSSIARLTPNIPGIKEATVLLDRFQLQISLESDHYYTPSKITDIDHLPPIHEQLAKLEFFKLRLSETGAQLSKQERQTSDLEQTIVGLSEDLEDARINSEQLKVKIDEKLAEATKFLENKQEEVNLLVGNMAARSLVGSFEQSAAIEKKTADNLRLTALLFMILVVGMVAKTFWEISSDGFDWEKSALRLICTIIFSVPAAYLARESAKHRQQQYTHLQTALDLKAIGPYLATLPKDRQDELKADMAQKIFAQKSFDHVAKESYPINAQDLILAMFDKLNDRKKKANQAAESSGAEAP